MSVPSVVEIVLFISTQSRASMECAKFVDSLNVNIPLVRLDSQEARDIASQGNLKISAVPTLVATYNDGTIQAFVGTNKIGIWLKNLLMASRQGQQHAPTQEPKGVTIISDDEEEEEKEAPARMISKPKKSAMKSSMKALKSGKKSKKKKKVQFLDQPVESSRNARIKAQLQGFDLNNGGTTDIKVKKFSSIQARAKQMEQERLDSLGYNEEDLPVSY